MPAWAQLSTQQLQFKQGERERQQTAFSFFLAVDGVHVQASSTNLGWTHMKTRLGEVQAAAANCHN